jgi:hypothetical protein
VLYSSAGAGRTSLVVSWSRWNQSSRAKDSDSDSEGHGTEPNSVDAPCDANGACLLAWWGLTRWGKKISPVLWPPHLAPLATSQPPPPCRHLLPPPSRSSQLLIVRPWMEHAADTETANCFRAETPLTTSHRHPSDRGRPVLFADHFAPRRATSARLPDNDLHRSHRRSGGSSDSDSDDDRLSLYPRRGNPSYHHAQHTPSHQTQSPPLPFRRPSQSSNSGSSSASTSTPVHVPSSMSATGRKVAANLQLFKETAPDVAELPQTDRSRSRPPSSMETPQIASPNEGEEVGETRFVRRTAWPDREAAAIRRGKSTISLKRVKTRDSDALLSSHDGNTKRDAVPDGSARKERAPSMHDDLIQDLVDWRPETLDRGRARDRERPVVFPSQSTPLTPSISPIRERRSAFRPRLGSRRSVQSVAFQEPPPSPSTKHPRRGSSATRPSPVQLSNRPLAPPPDVAPLQDVSVSPDFESSWSTDDESAWDTASLASSLATTTSPFVTQDEFPDLSTTPPGRRAHHIPDTSPLEEEDDEAAYGTLDELDPSTAPLPSVPLKPFKNQVGGHSAIYKFTKRAVCKVRTPPHRLPKILNMCLPLSSLPLRGPNLISHPLMYGSPWSPEKIYSTKLLRARLRLFSVSSPDTWASCSLTTGASVGHLAAL